MAEHARTLKAIYDEHFQFVWRSLRRLGVREADVPDAVQDVFIVVHRKLPEFEGRSKITTWLFGIALRVARDRQKLAYGRRHVDDEQAVAGCVDTSADIVASLERKQGPELLESILDSMPIEQRAVFTLFELEGMTGEAIAELVEAPLGTVYSRLRLAREAFQRAIARVRAAEGRRPPPPPPRKSGVRQAVEPVESSPSSETREANFTEGESDNKNSLGPQTMSARGARTILEVERQANFVEGESVRRLPPRRLAAGGAS